MNAATSTTEKKQSWQASKRTERIIRKNAAWRRDCEQLTLQWQERLWYRGVQEDVLRSAALYLQPAHIDDVVEERNSSNLCGYPICNNAPMEVTGRYKIDATNRKILDLAPLRAYCSKTCFAAAIYFKAQLEETPVFMRNFSKQPYIDIAHLDLSTEQCIRRYIEGRLKTAQETIPSTELLEKPLVIIDRDQTNTPTSPRLSENTLANTVDHQIIEGFSVYFDSRRQSSFLIDTPSDRQMSNSAGATTMILRQDTPQTTMHIETILPLPSTSQTQPSTKLTQKQTTRAKSENIVTPTLSRFGLIFHLVSRATTTRTKRFLLNQLSPTSTFVSSDQTTDFIITQPELLQQRNIFTERLQRIMKTILCCLRITDAPRNTFLAQIGPLSATLQLSEAIVDAMLDDTTISWSLALIFLYGLLTREAMTYILESEAWSRLFCSMTPVVVDQSATGDIATGATSSVIDNDKIKWISTTVFFS